MKKLEEMEMAKRLGRLKELDPELPGKVNIRTFQAWKASLKARSRRKPRLEQIAQLGVSIDWLAFGRHLPALPYFLTEGESEAFRPLEEFLNAGPPPRMEEQDVKTARLWRVCRSVILAWFTGVPMWPCDEEMLMKFEKANPDLPFGKIREEMEKAGLWKPEREKRCEAPWEKTIALGFLAEPEMRVEESSLRGVVELLGLALETRKLPLYCVGHEVFFYGECPACNLLKE